MPTCEEQCLIDFDATIAALEAEKKERLAKCNGDPACEAIVYEWHSNAVSAAYAAYQACLKACKSRATKT